MNAVKAYLLRLILCGLLVSMAGTLPKGKTLRRAVTICGGCLMILTTLRPLLQVDFSRLPELGTGLGLSQSQGQEAAREKNEALLRALVEEQTAQWILDQAQTLGFAPALRVEAENRGDGLWVPVRVRLWGAGDRAQRLALEGLLYKSLDLPPGAVEWEDE